MNGFTPVKAIREKCLECSAGQAKEVRECLIHDCSLYPFRLGKNPNRKGIGNLKGGFSQDSLTQLNQIDRSALGVGPTQG